MPPPVLTAYDGHTPSAVRVGEQLASLLGLGLHVAIAYTYEPAAVGSGHGLAPDNELRLEAAERALEALPVGPEVSRSSLPVEAVAPELLQLAAELGAAAIVVGADRHGHVTREVVQHATCPVVVAPHDPLMLADELRAIGVAFDGSVTSRFALAAARRMAGAGPSGLRLARPRHTARRGPGQRVVQARGRPDLPGRGRPGPRPARRGRATRAHDGHPRLIRPQGHGCGTHPDERRAAGWDRGGMNLKRWSTPLFRLGIVLIALHVVDDNFLQPQPGTSAGDHVFSGLIPLAILGLAAWVYPRIRPGLQASTALALVLPAVLSGAEAIYYAGNSGLAGDDYTGLLAMAAAPIMLVLGVWTLWSSRRLGDHPARRYGRRVLKVVGVLVAAMTFALPVSIAYVSSHVTRAEVPEADLGAAHEDVRLRTSDGLRLEGWYVPSRNRAAVLVFPGRTGARKQARMLVRHGYGVLLMDRRGEGHSEGDPNGWGWDFDKDIRAGLDFLQHRADVDPQRIGGLGLSVGGEMMLQTAADDEDLAAVVSEGAGARSMAEEVDDVSGLAKVTTALSYGARDLANSVLQNRLPPANLTTLIGKISPRPVFLIHGGADDAGHRNPDYYAAAKQPKQIWEARGGHTDGISEQPREYERRVVGFLDGALLGR